MGAESGELRREGKATELTETVNLGTTGHRSIADADSDFVLYIIRVPGSIIHSEM